MPTNPFLRLSRRERQILDVLYLRGEATVADILADLADPPTDSALRALLRILERKGHVRRRARDRSYAYRPALPVRKARLAAMRHLIETFFAGSKAQAIRAILADGDTRLTDRQLAQLEAMVDRAEDEAE
jgi:predicted transcriptional regulator